MYVCHSEHSLYLDDIVQRLPVLAVKPELVLSDPVQGPHARLVSVAGAPLVVVIAAAAEGQVDASISKFPGKSYPILGFKRSECIQGCVNSPPRRSLRVSGHPHHINLLN